MGGLGFPWVFSPPDVVFPSAEEEQVKERILGTGRKGAEICRLANLLPSPSGGFVRMMAGDGAPGSGQAGRSFLKALGDSCSFLGTGLGKELTDPYSGFSNISGFVVCCSSIGKGSAMLFPKSLGLEGHSQCLRGS